MSLHLITGYKGTAHITAEDTGVFNAGVYGSGEYVQNIGNKFVASLTSSNTVKILDGSAVIQGRHIVLAADTYEEITINNGTVGKSRNDLIVIRYTKDSVTGVENVVFAVVQGEATTDTPTDPEITTGDILSGTCLLHEMPLYRIRLTGVTVGTPEALFEVTPTIEQLETDAKNSLRHIGNCPISSADEDTVAFWLSLGSGIWYVSDWSIINGKEKYYTGTLISTCDNGKVTQLFLTDGSVYYRSGNSSAGWYVFYKEHMWKALKNKVATAYGSYWGTGLYGIDNPNILNFGFRPDFLIVKRGTDMMIAIRGETMAYLKGYDGDFKVTSYDNKIRWIDWSVSWWYPYEDVFEANKQSNINGVEYFYFAGGVSFD